MTNEELAARLERLENAMVVLRDLLSRTTGENDASACALAGLLEAIGRRPGVQDSVSRKLEQFYAMQLAESRNQIYVDEFSLRADLLQAATCSALDEA